MRLIKILLLAGIVFVAAAFAIIILAALLPENIFSQTNIVWGQPVDVQIDAKGNFRAHVFKNFSEPLPAYLQLRKVGNDSVVYATTWDEERDFLKTIAGPWKLEPGVEYNLVLRYRPTGERWREMQIKEKIVWQLKK